MPAATLTRPARTTRTITAAPAAPAVDRRQDSGWVLGDVEVVVDGTTARLRYTTNAPLVEVLVSVHRPHLVDGTWIEPIQSCTAGAEIGGGRGTVSVLQHRLQPGATYHYVLTVPTTADQRPVQVVGSFVATSRIAEAVAALAAA